MKWIPFNCKTHFSLLKAFSKCDKLAAKCKEYGYRACVITDMECLSGAVNFHESCHKHGIRKHLVKIISLTATKIVASTTLQKTRRRPTGFFCVPE